MALAVALRVAWPGVAEFKLDEAQPWALAGQIWCEGRLPLTRGITSFGLPGTPGVAYLLVLPRAVSADPRGAVIFMGLLGALAVLATYLAVRRFAEEPLALVTSALYAANPWAVMLSRKTWSEVQPLLTVLLIWVALEVVVHRKAAWGFAFFPLAALQVQVHVMGVLYLPALLLTILLFWRRWKSWHIWLGLALGMLILTPYVWALRGQWQAMGAALGQGAPVGLSVDARALSYALWLTSGRTLTALLGQSVAALRGVEQALGVINLVTAGAMACGAVACIGTALRRQPGYERQVLLLTWLLGPLAPLLFLREAKGVHYLLLLVPALFLLVGLVWTFLLRLPRRGLRAVAGLAFVASLAIQLGALMAVYYGVQHYPTQGGFGRPLELWCQVQQEVQRRACDDGIREIEVVGVEDSSWTGERVVLDSLLQQTVHLRYPKQGAHTGLLLPERGDALALVVAADSETASILKQYGIEQKVWPSPGSKSDIRLYRLAPASPERVAQDLALAGYGVFESGWKLLGIREIAATSPGGRLDVLSYWAYTGQGERAAEMAFVHLVDASGRRWAQDDGFALRRSEWRPGEVLVQPFRLRLPAEMPPGYCWLDIGMYSLRDMGRARLLDAQGHALNDKAVLGPISILDR